MSCTSVLDTLDFDQTFTVHDFGPRGHSGPVTVNLNHGLQPGAMIGAVLVGDHEVNLNVFDDQKKNALFSFAARLYKGQLACNSLVDGAWGPKEETTEVSSWKKGTRASLCLLYDTEGFRLYINGESTLFLKHRSKTIRASLLEIANGRIFKVIYNASMKIIP